MKMMKKLNPYPAPFERGGGVTLNRPMGKEISNAHILNR